VLERGAPRARRPAPAPPARRRRSGACSVSTACPNRPSRAPSRRRAARAAGWR
jgi:hypothetical protein